MLQNTSAHKDSKDYKIASSACQGSGSRRLQQYPASVSASSFEIGFWFRVGDQISGITVDKSVEFSFEELSRATDNFSLANKNGQDGFGAVYHARLRGEKAAIKKMEMHALTVLT